MRQMTRHLYLKIVCARTKYLQKHLDTRTHFAVTQHTFIHMAKSIPIQRHPHSASVKLCEKKFPIFTILPFIGHPRHTATNFGKQTVALCRGLAVIQFTFLRQILICWLLMFLGLVSLSQLPVTQKFGDFRARVLTWVMLHPIYMSEVPGSNFWWYLF